jgi:hypothetical protein
MLEFDYENESEFNLEPLVVPGRERSSSFVNILEAD